MTHNSSLIRVTLFLHLRSTAGESSAESASAESTAGESASAESSAESSSAALLSLLSALVIAAEQVQAIAHMQHGV